MIKIILLSLFSENQVYDRTNWFYSFSKTLCFFIYTLFCLPIILLAPYYLDIAKDMYPLLNTAGIGLFIVLFILNMEGLKDINFILKNNSQNFYKIYFMCIKYNLSSFKYKKSIEEQSYPEIAFICYLFSHLSLKEIETLDKENDFLNFTVRYVKYVSLYCKHNLFNQDDLKTVKQQINNNYINCNSFNFAASWDDFLNYYDKSQKANLYSKIELFT